MTAIWMLFTLLSAFRNKTPPSHISGFFRQLGLPLQPRLPFWLALCQQAAFLNPQGHPTGFFHQWLCWPPEDQTRHLLQAWQAASHGRKNRMWRARLLRRLQYGQVLQTTDSILLPGLQALGICCDNHLSLWGKVVLSLHPAPTLLWETPWYIEADRLFIPSPVNWSRLWKLETFLTPIAPFSYSLDDKALRQAAQRGKPEELIEVIEQGTAASLPGNLRARILGQPVLRLSSGLLLEFSSPAELRQLRRSPALRPYFERMLSPRHVSVDPSQAPRLLAMLARRGVYAFEGEQVGDGENHLRGKRTHFSQVELLQPLGAPVSLRDFIVQAIQLQQAFDMLYHAPSGERPEVRRITPLALEQRGGHTYVSAYCHTRKGNRLFRLDRMEVPGTF